MSLLTIELQKEKRTGVIPVLIVVGILGAAYALVNFFVRKNTLLSLPLAPMDVLLTQLYGTLLILNMFGIIVVCFHKTMGKISSCQKQQCHNNYGDMYFLAFNFIHIIPLF